MRYRLGLGLGILCAGLAIGGIAEAGQLHVRDSNLSAETIIRGRHAEYVIRFDGLVDHAASRLEIMQSGRVVQSLSPRLNSAPDVLFASGQAPAAGQYVLRWHARSSADGSMSDGDIPFSVSK